MVPLIVIIARLVFIVVTIVVFSFSVLTYARLRSKKMLLLTIGFGLFFVHGLIAIPEIFSRPYNFEFTDSLHLLIDATAILFVLLGVLKSSD